MFISTVKNGYLSGVTSRKIHDYISTFEGRQVIITVERLSSKRSGQQNRYLHLLFSIFTQALNELGNDFSMEDVKALCKLKFATIDVVNENTGEVLGQRIKGTSEMKKLELAEFVDKIIEWGKEFNIILPYPNQQLEIA